MLIILIINNNYISFCQHPASANLAEVHENPPNKMYRRWSRNIFRTPRLNQPAIPAKEIKDALRKMKKQANFATPTLS